MSTRLEFRSRIRLPHECCDLLYMLSSSNQLSFLRFALIWLFPALCSCRYAQFFPRVSPYPYFPYTIVQVSSGALHLSEPNINSPTAATSTPHRQTHRRPRLVPRLTLWRTWRTPTPSAHLEDLAEAHPNSQSEGPGGRPPQQSIRRTWRTPPQQTVHHSEDEPAEESHHPRRSCA